MNGPFLTISLSADSGSSSVDLQSQQQLCCSAHVHGKTCHPQNCQSQQPTFRVFRWGSIACFWHGGLEIPSALPIPFCREEPPGPAPLTCDSHKPSCHSCSLSSSCCYYCCCCCWFGLLSWRCRCSSVRQRTSAIWMQAEKKWCCWCP